MKITIFLLVVLFSCGILSNTVEKTKLKTATINTFGMHCTGCEETIEAEVKKIDGVKSVKADHIKKKVIVKYESSKTNIGLIKEAIKTAGYRLQE